MKCLESQAYTHSGTSSSQIRLLLADANMHFE